MLSLSWMREDLLRVDFCYMVIFLCVSLVNLLSVCCVMLIGMVVM